MDAISLKNKRILITGGNGYLGTYLVQSLVKLGADVYVIDQNKIGVSYEYMVNITKLQEVKDFVQEVQPQIVFHLAAMLNRDRDFTNHQKIVDVNYAGTMNLLLALQEVEVCENFIFTSTSEIYGENQSPFTEDLLPQPVSPYSMSKEFAETAIRTFSRIHKSNYTILRLFNFFGPNMPQNFFIPQLIHALKNDTNFKMTEGEQARDFLWIDDVVQALLLAASNKNAHKQTFNVCSGQSITLRNFVILAKDAFESNCTIDFGALPYRESEVWNMVGSNNKIKNALGFKVKNDLKTVLKTL